MNRQTSFLEQAFFTVVLSLIAGAGVASLLSFARAAL
jgi:hypothetical protein